MNIEKWIKDNTWRGHVDEAALRELLKTHAIAPREMSEDATFESWEDSTSEYGMDYDETKEMYKAMIKAAENG